MVVRINTLVTVAMIVDAIVSIAWFLRTSDVSAATILILEACNPLVKPMPSS
jgi:hypothetical protein